MEAYGLGAAAASAGPPMGYGRFRPIADDRHLWQEAWTDSAVTWSTPTGTDGVIETFYREATFLFTMVGNPGETSRIASNDVEQPSKLSRNGANMGKRALASFQWLEQGPLSPSQ